MKKLPNSADDPVALRFSAEQQLAVKPNTAAIPIDEKRLVHELQVHQIELEMLNENLRHAQSELEKSWACYYDLYESAPVGYLTVNDRNIILNANLMVSTLLGVTRNDLLKKPFTQFILASDLDQYYLHHKQLLEAGITSAFELRIVKQDGVASWVRVQMNRVVVPEGAQIFRVVLMDISERKQAEEKLLDASRHKDEFIAMLGHELRNPLTPISIAAEILNSNPLDQTTLDWVRGVLIRNTAHITRLINDLLEASRITRGLINIEMERIDLLQVLRESADSVHTLLHAKHQILDLQLPEEPIYLNGDHIRLVQVFCNLMNNAVKYTGNGGRIALKAEVERQSVSIVIHDNGIGIAPELLPQIFDFFIQGNKSLDRSEGGLGIGLTLVKKLVEQHGGNVTAESQGLGQGSSFTVRLPIRFEDEKQGEIVPKNDSDSENVAHRLRVLLIDDNQDVVDSLSLILKGWGYQVASALTGMDGLTLAENVRPDVILLDIGLPVMDGYQVAKKLREKPCSFRGVIIALSGYDSEQNPHHVETTDIDHFLTKSPNLNELRNLIAGIESSNQALQPPDH